MNLDGASGLYLLNLCVDKVILVNAAAQKRRSVCLQAFFWGLPMINIYQARTSSGFEDGPDPDVFAHFEVGTTGYFHSATIDLIRSIQRHPIVITVFQNLDGANCFEPVGTCRVKVTEKFSELISRAATCAIKHAVSGVIKGVYNVLNKEHIQVGTISLSVRLVCYDNSLLKTPYVSANQSNAVGSVEHSKYLLPKKTSDGFVLVPVEGPGDRFTEPFPQDLGCSDVNAPWPQLPISGGSAALSPIDITGLVCDTTMSERFFIADQSNDSFVSQRRGDRRNEANDSYTVEHPSGKAVRDREDSDARKMTIETYLSDSGTDTKRRLAEYGRATDSATRLQESAQNLMPVQIYRKGGSGSADGSRNSSVPASPAETHQRPDGSGFKYAEDPDQKQPDQVMEDQPHDSGKKSTSELILSAFAPRLKKQVDCDPFNYEYSKASQRICEKYLSRKQERAQSSKPFEKQSSQNQVSEKSFEQMETTASPIPSQYSGHGPAEEGTRLSENSASKQPLHDNASRHNNLPEKAIDTGTQQQELELSESSLVQHSGDVPPDVAASQPQKLSSSDKTAPQPPPRQQPFVRQNCVQVDSSEKLISRWAQAERTATKCTQSDICIDGKYVGLRFSSHTGTAAWNPPSGQEASDTPRQSDPQKVSESEQPEKRSSNQSSLHRQSYIGSESQEIRPSTERSDFAVQDRHQNKENHAPQSPIPEETRPLSDSSIQVLDTSAEDPCPVKATSIASFQVREICKCCLRHHDPPPFPQPENVSRGGQPYQLLPISPGEDTAPMNTSSASRVEAVRAVESTSTQRSNPQQLAQYSSRVLHEENNEMLQEYKTLGRTHLELNSPTVLANYSQMDNAVMRPVSNQREPESSVMGLYSPHQGSGTKAPNLELNGGQNVPVPVPRAVGDESSPYRQQASPIEGVVTDTIVYSCHNYNIAGTSCGFCMEINPESLQRPEPQPDMNSHQNGKWDTPGNGELKHHAERSKRQQALSSNGSASKKKTSWSFQNGSFKEGPPNRIQTAAEKVLLLCGCQRHIQRPPEASNEVQPDFDKFVRKPGDKPQAECLLPADCALRTESPVPAPRRSKREKQEPRAEYQLTSGENIVEIHNDQSHLASLMNGCTEEDERAAQATHHLCGGFQPHQTDSRWKHHGKPRSRSRGGQTDTRHLHARRTAKQDEYTPFFDAQTGKAEAYFNDYRNIENASGKSNYLSVQPSEKQQRVGQLYPGAVTRESNTGHASTMHACDCFDVPHRQCAGYVNSPCLHDKNQSGSETARCKNEEELYPRVPGQLRDPCECRRYRQKNPDVLITPVESPGVGRLGLGHSHSFPWGEMRSASAAPMAHADNGGPGERGSHRSDSETPNQTTCSPRPNSTPTCNASSISRNSANTCTPIGGYLHYGPRSYCHDFRDLNLSGYGGYGARTILNACVADSCSRSRCMWPNNCRSC